MYLQSGVNADGRIVSASHVPLSIPIKGMSESQKSAVTLGPTSTRAKAEPSLLSRLGIKVAQTNGELEKRDTDKGKKAVTPTVRSNGDRDAQLPSSHQIGSSSDLLEPYQGLLRKAGVDSIITLRRLVRPGTIREYVDMLSVEYPDEQLLNGLTGKWALRERLEEWLRDKKEPASDLVQRSAKK